MREYTLFGQGEIDCLRQFAETVGKDPLLTQGSTGNISLKLDGVLWIKESGKWLAEAAREDILTALDWPQVMRCVREGIDPAIRFPGASVETAMHAIMPHRVTLHVHCVSAIAWSVRQDAPSQLKPRLEGLRWAWIPYVASGLALARRIEQALSSAPDRNIFVLGNHGLVIAGESIAAVECHLAEWRTRASLPMRQSHPADYAALLDLSGDSAWDLPDDDAIHALGADPVSLSILSAGVLHPCQAMFGDPRITEIFRAVSFPESQAAVEECRRRRDPFLIVAGRGVLVNRSITPGEYATLAGLAQVVERIGASGPVRYLTSEEVAELCCDSGHRYLAGVGHRENQ